MIEQLEMFPELEPKAPPSASPGLLRPPMETLAAVHSQAATIAEALADLDIRLPLPSKPGTHKVRCPQCFPAGTKTKRTDLVVVVRTNEALFRCRHCQFSRRLTVGRQP